MVEHPFDRVTESALRLRQSAKWSRYPGDVLPAWVAEMDFPTAEPIKRALHAAIGADDLGYADPRGLGATFAPFARARFGWDVRAGDVAVVPDVIAGIAELLRVATRPGDGVVIEPPVYPPFAATIRSHERVVVEAPLAFDAPRGWSLDLEALERAYAGGARAHILCSPHNPTGIVHPRETLVRVAEMAAHYGVLVLADEIHAPLTLPPAKHVPFPTVSNEAARTSVVLTSASKAWNLAGLKAAVVVACSDETRAITARLPRDLRYHAGHLGIVGARVAFAEGGPWLTSALEALDRNRHLVATLLREHVPGVVYTPPQASYLAWLDCRALGLGDDPARAFLERGKVAVSSGPTFGRQGAGFARLNMATTRTLLEEAVRRLARATSR
jgi:cysteine-S-conjugate beta-lyase